MKPFRPRPTRTPAPVLPLNAADADTVARLAAAVDATATVHRSRDRVLITANIVYADEIAADLRLLGYVLDRSGPKRVCVTGWRPAHGTSAADLDARITTLYELRADAADAGHYTTEGETA